MTTYPKGFPIDNSNAREWLEALEPEFRNDLITVADSVKGDFVLKEVQWLEVIQQLKIFFKDAIAVDTSQTGAGKTFMAMFIAKVWSLYARRLNLPFKLLVIYAKNAAASWAEWFERLDLYPYFESSYEYLACHRDTPGKPGDEEYEQAKLNWTVCNHGYLASRPSTKRRNYTCYQATSSWAEDAIANCNFIIVDEVQKCKNETSNNHAVAALLSPLTQSSLAQMGGGSYKYSRALLMSATPYDSQDNIVPWFRLFGAITEDLLIEGTPKNYTQVGLDQILTYCRQADPFVAGEIIAEYEGELVPGGKYREALLQLFIEIIVTKFFHGIPADIPEDLYSGVSIFKLPKKYKCGRICIDKDKLAEMRQVLKRLKDVIIWGAKNLDGSRDFSRNMGEYTKIYQELQTLKLPFMVEEGMEWLRDNPRSKLVLVVNYLSHVETLKQEFAAYGPLVLTGEIKSITERKRLEELFRQSDLEHRVFIFTSGAGSVSISLHDTHGDFPRQIIIMPSFNNINMLQASGRVVRTGLNSKTLIKNIYVNDYDAPGDTGEFLYVVTDSDNPDLKATCLEKRLLEKINKRSETVRTALINNNIERKLGKGILFFDQFKIKVEQVPECS